MISPGYTRDRLKLKEAKRFDCETRLWYFFELFLISEPELPGSRSIAQFIKACNYSARRCWAGNRLGLFQASRVFDRENGRDLSECPLMLPLQQLVHVARQVVGSGFSSLLKIILKSSIRLSIRRWWIFIVRLKPFTVCLIPARSAAICGSLSASGPRIFTFRIRPRVTLVSSLLVPYLFREKAEFQKSGMSRGDLIAKFVNFFVELRFIEFLFRYVSLYAISGYLLWSTWVKTCRKSRSFRAGK